MIYKFRVGDEFGLHGTIKKGDVITTDGRESGKILTVNNAPPKNSGPFGFPKNLEKYGWELLEQESTFLIFN
jgi:hypothetical protein